MSYDISFKAKLEGADKWVYVGPEWINHTSNTSAMIKEVCSSYPSEWDDYRCSEILPIIETGCTILRSHSQQFRQFEDAKGWGTVESTLKFLDDIHKGCEEYPTAVLEVRC